MNKLNRFFKSALVFFALALSFQSWGVPITVNGGVFHEDFEVATHLHTPLPNATHNTNLSTYISSGSECYRKPTFTYNSLEPSTRFKRAGTRSIRVENHGDVVSQDFTNTNFCKNDEPKSRTHFAITNVAGINIPGTFESMQGMGEGRWLGFSVYIPSDEGTINTWWNAKDSKGDPEYSNIFQFMGKSGTTDMSPELFVKLGNGGDVIFQNYYRASTDAKELVKNRATGKMYKDKWNDVVVFFKRGANNNGVLKIWINDVKYFDQSNFTNAIYNFPMADLHFGHYFGSYITNPDGSRTATGRRNQTYVLYFDALRVATEEAGSFAVVDPKTYDDPNPPVCPSADPRCPPVNPPLESSITAVNDGAAITQNQPQVNFDAVTTGGNAAYLACMFNNNAADERSVVWNTTTNTTGYFGAGNVNQYTSTTAELKCFYEAYLTPIAANGSWATQGVDVTEYSGNAFGYTSGLTITKNAGGSNRLVTKGDGTLLYGAVPVWTPAAGYEVEFDIVFPTTTALNQAEDYILDSNGTGGVLKPGILLDDATNTIVFQAQTGRTLTMDGVAVTSGVTLFPTDGVPRHMKMVGTSGLELRRILRRYTAVSYGKSTVYNLSLKDLSNSSNNSFYALNEDSTTAVIVDTGIRAANGTWYNRGAEDVITLGTGASNPAFAYKILGASHAFSGVATDRMALDITYSCTSVPNCSNLYLAVVDSSGDRRNVLKGTAGALTADTLNGGFGTSKNIKNWTVDAAAGVYRARTEFRIGSEGYSNNYSVYAGMLDGVTSQAFTIHSIIPHKNYVTKSSTFSVTLDSGDTDNPDLSNCAMNMILDPIVNDGLTYRATISCDTDELGGDAFAMITTTNTAPNAAAIEAATGAAWAGQAPVDSSTITFESGGWSYQNLWGWLIQKDEAGLVSSVQAVSFSTGLPPGTVKRIKFSNANTRLRKLDGTVYSGPLDYFVLLGNDPRTPGPKTELVYIDNPTITGGLPNFTEADVLCETCTGSINALEPGQYWYSARSLDGTLKAVNRINVVAE